MMTEHIYIYRFAFNRNIVPVVVMIFQDTSSSSVDSSEEAGTAYQRAPHGISNAARVNANGDVESDAFSGDFSSTPDNDPKMSASLTPPSHRPKTTTAMPSTKNPVSTGLPPTDGTFVLVNVKPATNGERVPAATPPGASRIEDTHVAAVSLTSSRCSDKISPRRVHQTSMTSYEALGLGYSTSGLADAPPLKNADGINQRAAYTSTAAGLDKDKMAEVTLRTLTPSRRSVSVGKNIHTAFSYAKTQGTLPEEKNSDQWYSGHPVPRSSPPMGNSIPRSANNSTRPSILNPHGSGYDGGTGAATCNSVESWRERIMWSTRPRRNSPRHTSSYNSSRAPSRLATPRAASVPVSSVGAHAHRGHHEDLARFVGAYNTPSRRFPNDIPYANRSNTDFIAWGSGVEMSHSPRYPSTPRRFKESRSYRVKHKLLDPPEPTATGLTTKDDIVDPLAELEKYQKRLERAVAIMALEREHRMLRHRR
ncbi:hypothetical protein, conserved [Trypanosoma brucei brucei TREU927]|uniref:Uncharacterized protein n=1 Tax=Trypanosoma brucei brucei (strain 927/4 GUTat10.1) TaxID=185431 RepID=Q38B17_TRYB2|nr:hypothetical protein, conserved [Trypanosoma brucei brucei TREU927]EAN78003.1 hypothetical protein, conserved [Trypanosoma brucei brucei TREU927]